MNKPKTLIVENEIETFEVNSNNVTIDHEKLNRAIAEYNQALSSRKEYESKLKALRERTEQLDNAIMDVERLLSQKPVMAGLSIEDIKQFADDQSKYRNQITALVEVRTGIEKEIAAMDERVIIIELSEAKQYIWRTVYEGLLTTIDKESLEQLFVAGSMIGKLERTIISDLSLSNDTRRLEAMAQQFNLPVGV